MKLDKSKLEAFLSYVIVFEGGLFCIPNESPKSNYCSYYLVDYNSIIKY